LHGPSQSHAPRKVAGGAQYGGGLNGVDGHKLESTGAGQLRVR
jgi:hypothetical protein